MNMDDLVEMVVDLDAFLPGMFSFTLADKEHTYVDGVQFDLGKAIEIIVSSRPFDESSDEKKSLIKGEITAIEPIFELGGRSLLRVRGYDKANRLTRGKNTRTFLKMTDSDVAQKIAQANGLSAQVDTSSITYEFLMQYNQSDWEFLWERARMLGYQVYVQDRFLHFEKANKERDRESDFSLTWGEDLSSFEPRVSVMGQASKAEAYGWDPATKKGLSSVVTSSSVSNVPGIGLPNKKGSLVVQSKFSAAIDVTASQPLSIQSHTEAIADSDLSARESNFIRANGLCVEGDPRIRTGVKVSIKNVGVNFSGTYYITHALHKWRNDGYTVNFSMAGSTPNTVFNLMQQERGQAANKIYGVVPGLVADVKDPQKLGRIKVKYPWLPKVGSAEIVSDWVRLVTPSGGPERGIYFLPEINDEVLIGFEQGDPNYPFVVGLLWNGKDKPPAGTEEIYGSDGKVNQRVIRSRTGHLIILDDTQGKEKVIIQDAGGKESIILDKTKKSITLKSDGDFVIEAGGKFQVKSKNEVVFEATGAFSVDSKKEATLKVANNKVSVANAGAEVSGVKVDVKAQTMASINGNAMVEVKGGLVKIN
jgi:phage protein D